MLQAHDAPLASIRDLKIHFPVRSRFLFGKSPGIVKAVDGVSFDIRRGETLGLVGESGCGKTTIGRAILQLNRITEGTIAFDGRNLGAFSAEEIRGLRRRVQLIFQDPYASLNPRMSVGRAIAEPIRLHGLRRGEPAIQARVRELLSLVGLAPHYASRYPHEFSGGQRQRIGIARALACEPELIICDEPVSALDVSIQAQVVNLLQDLQRQLGLTYLFIAHGLSGRSDVSGPHRGDRRPARRLRQSAPSLHAIAFECRTDPRPEGRARQASHRPPRGNAEPS